MLKTGKNTVYIVKSITGIAIMLLFRFLPVSFSGVTEGGMAVLGIFLGMVFLWMTTDLMWPSLLGVFLIGCSGVMDFNEVLSGFLGNSTMMLLMFMMILSGAFSTYEITQVLAGRVLRLKIMAGHPLIFVMMISLTCYLMSLLINPFTPILLFFPILSEIFSSVGMTEKDVFSKMMFIFVVLAALAGYAVPPYMGTPLVLISNFNRLTGGEWIIDPGVYLIKSFTTGALLTVGSAVLSMIIFRPDVSAFKKYRPEGEGKKLNFSQRIILIAFIVMIVLMIIPIFVHTDSTFINGLGNASSALPLLAVAMLAAIPAPDTGTFGHGEGPHIINILQVQKIMQNEFQWGTYFMCGAAILIGNTLTADSTGITNAMINLFSPVMMNMGRTGFIILMVSACVLVTNVCNSLVVALIAEPVVASYCQITGVNGTGIILPIIFAALIPALFTPAASPFAAVLHGNREWVKSSEIIKYGLPAVLFEALLFMSAGLMM